LTQDPERARKINLSIGGLIGIGSFIYGFLRIGEWLDEPSLVQEAHEASVLITPERIAQDQRVRIQTGSAGAILALLALRKAMPRANGAGKSPLDVAFECARRLLDTRISYEGRPKAWVLSPDKPPLLGFCYGAAGCSFALLRLFEASPDPEVWQAALEGWDYVDSFYQPRERQWLDVRALLRSRFTGPAAGSWTDWWFSGTTNDLDLLPKQAASDEEGEDPSSLTLANKWCHGAPGILMARLATLSLLDAPEIRGEIDGAIGETRWFAEAETFSQYPADDLCCGHMGRVESLLYASLRSRDEGLMEDARTLADRVIRRARDKGTYTVTAARGTEHFSPSFFQGYAGIGYTLLRLARPGVLPSLLLLE
jgi:lantibiotic modifying enzyme